MFPIFRTLLRAVTKPTLRLPQVQSRINLFHILSKAPHQRSTAVGNLLGPTTVSVIPSCGFKVKGMLKKRCKDCYFVRRQDRLFVICETHPRHKQMQMVKKEKNTWILTHATQSKIRPW